jgi:peptidoglycan/LPS O-acetylase OafA/YrhL
VKDFYKKRLLRIYPIYWIAVLYSLLLINYEIPTVPLTDYARTFWGFQIFFTTTAQDSMGKINGSFWFIGVIISLYFLYPLVSLAIKRHPHISLLSVTLVAFVSRMIMNYVFPQFISGSDWFPLCRLFEFGLGIYITQRNLYPRINSNSITRFLGNLSFYVYLTEWPLLTATNYSNIGFALFTISTIVFAIMFYAFDMKIQEAINR